MSSTELSESPWRLLICLKLRSNISVAFAGEDKSPDKTNQISDIEKIRVERTYTPLAKRHLLFIIFYFYLAASLTARITNMPN